MAGYLINKKHRDDSVVSIKELEGTSDELVDESSEKEGEVKENV